MASNVADTMPDGYLLDTNVFSAFHSQRHQHHQRVRDFLNNGPPSRGVPLLMSVVNLMELDFGVRLAKARDDVERPDLDSMLQAAQAYDHRPIDRFVVDAYSEMRVRLAMRFLPNKVRQLGRLGEIERWRNEVSNELLHVEEGDMWLAAQAVVLDLTLVTLEPKFVRFQEVSHPHLKVHLLR
jgi:predicted nucleic acid-binding protein